MLYAQALLSMDEDGDGEITEFEFLRFMLSQADITSTDIVDSLHARFQVAAFTFWGT